MSVKAEIVDPLHRSDALDAINPRPDHLRMGQAFELLHFRGRRDTPGCAPGFHLGDNRLEALP